jgi:hypothetical protein
MSILGIIFSVIFILWYILMIDSNGKISLEEFFPIALLFGLYSLAFSITVLSKSNKK